MDGGWAMNARGGSESIGTRKDDRGGSVGGVSSGDEGNG